MQPPENPADEAVTMQDLFDDLGTERLRYAARCCALTGAWVQFEAHVSRTHDGSGWLVVDQPGACPDCSAVPVAALQLPGFALPDDQAETAQSAPVVLRGRLSYGFQIDAAGTASFLRLEEAQVLPAGAPVKTAAPVAHTLENTP